MMSAVCCPIDKKTCFAVCVVLCKKRMAQCLSVFLFKQTMRYFLCAVLCEQTCAAVCVRSHVNQIVVARDVRVYVTKKHVVSLVCSRILKTKHRVLAVWYLMYNRNVGLYMRCLM